MYKNFSNVVNSNDTYMTILVCSRGYAIIINVGIEKYLNF